ncbi:MAG: hypothetical protein IT374_15595 [Polyangiaceae bacterium]|nr:hypothetical protein [Polyangiaceae bacterium]
MSPATTRRVLVALVALAGPVILGLDLGVRALLMSMQPEDVREFLAGEVTRLAWYCVPAPVVGALAAFVAYPRLRARFTGRAGGDRVGADLKALFVTASFIQLPALLGDLSVMLGARLTPALLMTSFSTLAVLALAAFAGARAA